MLLKDTRDKWISYDLIKSAYSVVISRKKALSDQ